MKVKDLTGRQFDRLYVAERAGSKNGQATWLCRCDCGNMVVMEGRNLTNGYRKSCGCISVENAKNARHRDSLYSVWNGIKNRCYNPNTENYQYYGGRGITVCDEWLNDFEAFKKWMLEHGYDYSKPYQEQEVDRKDNSKGYSPDNCRIVTHTQNARNTRNNKFLTYNGETLTAGGWAEKLGVPMARIKERMKKSDDAEYILFAEPRSQRSNTGIKGISYQKSNGKYILYMNRKYIGSFKTLEEAVKRKEEYLLEISKNITRQNTNQNRRCRVQKRSSE